MPIRLLNDNKLTIKVKQNTSIISTGSTGGISSISNVGGGVGVFKQRTGVIADFKTLVAGANINLSATTDTIIITSTASGSTGGGVPVITFNSYTGATDTILSGLRSDVDTVSGQTASKLNISIFNTYSGATNTTLGGLRTDINTVSGDTTQLISDVNQVELDLSNLAGNVSNNTSAISGKLETSVFNSYTGATDTILSGLRSDVDTVSGQTASKLNISEFNSYTGATNTTLGGLRTDIDTVSGQTVQNTTDIGLVSGVTTTNTTNIATNATGITANFNSITGNTANISTLSATTETKGDRTLTIVSVTGATSLVEDDNGKMFEANGTFSITVPDGLTTGWNCSITNVGTGVITIAGGATIQSRDSLVTLANQFGGATLYHRGSNNIALIGDLT